MTYSTRALRALFGVASMAAALALAVGAHAQITEADVGYNLVYSQSGPSTISFTGAFFAAREDLTNPGDFASATLNYPGPGTPVTLLPSSGPILIYETGFLPDLATMQTDFPTGTYQFVAMGATPQTDTISFNGATFSSIPALTAASYNSLQGLRPNASDMLSFSPFGPNSNAPLGYVFVTISDGSGTVLNEGFLPDSTTGILLPANLLAPDTTYNMELVYSERVPDNDGQIYTTALSDIHTEIAFTTGADVPEPAIWALTMLGIGMTGFALRRRREGVVLAA